MLICRLLLDQKSENAPVGRGAERARKMIPTWLWSLIFSTFSFAFSHTQLASPFDDPQLMIERVRRLVKFSYASIIMRSSHQNFGSLNYEHLYFGKMKHNFMNISGQTIVIILLRIVKRWEPSLQTWIPTIFVAVPKTMIARVLPWLFIILYAKFSYKGSNQIIKNALNFPTVICYAFIFDRENW